MMGELLSGYASELVGGGRHGRVGWYKRTSQEGCGQYGKKEDKSVFSTSETY